MDGYYYPHQGQPPPQPGGYRYPHVQTVQPIQHVQPMHMPPDSYVNYLQAPRQVQPQPHPHTLGSVGTQISQVYGPAPPLPPPGLLPPPPPPTAVVFPPPPPPPSSAPLPPHGPPYTASTASQPYNHHTSTTGAQASEVCHPAVHPGDKVETPPPPQHLPEKPESTSTSTVTNSQENKQFESRLGRLESDVTSISSNISNLIELMTKKKPDVKEESQRKVKQKHGKQNRPVKEVHPQPVAQEQKDINYDDQSSLELEQNIIREDVESIIDNLDQYDDDVNDTIENGYDPIVPESSDEGDSTRNKIPLPDYSQFVEGVQHSTPTSTQAPGLRRSKRRISSDSDSSVSTNVTTTKPRLRPKHQIKELNEKRTQNPNLRTRSPSKPQFRKPKVAPLYSRRTSVVKTGSNTVNCTLTIPVLEHIKNSPDYEVIGPDKQGGYSIHLRTLGQADDILGLNPKRKYPFGKDVSHLRGDERKTALNCIRQRAYQRKRNCKLRCLMVLLHREKSKVEEVVQDLLKQREDYNNLLRQDNFRKGKKEVISKQYHQSERQRKCRANKALLMESASSAEETSEPDSQLLTPDSSESNSSFTSDRTRASTARKHLPKHPLLQCRTIIRLFTFAMTNRKTRHIMTSELAKNDNFKRKAGFLKNLVSDETKEAHKLMRQAYALRSKGRKKVVVLQQKVKQIKSKFSMRKIQSLTGMTYREIYRIVNPPSEGHRDRRVTQEDRVALYKCVLQTVHSMQIPYRRFAKYFYLRETLKDTYTAYANEQRQLGLRILKESTMYKNLPPNMRCQKYIPFMECLCSKCLNFAGFIDAIRIAGVTIERKSLFHIIQSICPFLVHKKDITGNPQPSQPDMKKNDNVKRRAIHFGKLEEAVFHPETLKLGKTSNTNISNDFCTEPMKHDPNFFLIDANNAPTDITTEKVVVNANPDCMFRECDKCGVHKVSHHLYKDNPHLASLLNKPVVWHKWTSFVEKINGKKVQRPFDRYRFDGTLEELLQVFFDAVHNMSKHYFHFKWQAVQYQKFRQTIQPGEVGLVMDFGQNINHRKQLEAQSTHYNRRQSTIFPLVCFFGCPLCSALVTHEICCITDDLKHDAYAVRAFELKAIEILKSSGVEVNHVYEWSDNCGLEFKSKMPFYVLSNIKLPITRNYWGENHGKGPADSVIGRVSQCIKSAIARGKTTINHGIDMVLYLQSHHLNSTYDPTEKKCQHYRQTFAYLDSINKADFNPTVETIYGTRQFHCVQNTGVPGTLKVRRSSCLCRACRDPDSGEQCRNEIVAGKWKEKTMTYQIPDMMLAKPVDDDLEEEMESMLSEEKNKKKGKAKNGKKGKRSKQSKSVTNTSSSNVDTTLDSSTLSNDTDTILSQVIQMETTFNKENKGRRYPTRSTGKSSDVEVVDAKVAKFKQNDSEFDHPVWIKERSVLMLPKSKRPPATQGYTHTIFPAQHDYTVWKSLGADMGKSNNWDRLLQVVTEYMQTMQLTHHVDSVFGVRLTWDKQDSMAHSLWPRDGPFDRISAFEINTEAVGDCLPAAVSRLVYGTQWHSHEMRLRMTVEGLLYEEWYLDSQNIAIDMPVLTTDKNFAEKYALFCGVASKDVHNFQKCYRDEVVRCSKAKQECALWQIHHMASVIRRPVISVFPEFDDVEEESPLRYYHNRTIMPRLERDRDNDAVTIMWTKASPFSTSLANHFVPVVRAEPIHELEYIQQIPDGAPAKENQHIKSHKTSAKFDVHTVNNTVDVATSNGSTQNGTGNGQSQEETEQDQTMEEAQNKEQCESELEMTNAPPPAMESDEGIIKVRSPTAKESDEVITNVRSPTAKESDEVITNVRSPKAKESDEVITKVSSPTAKESDEVITKVSSPNPKSIESCERKKRLIVKVQDLGECQAIREDYIMKRPEFTLSRSFKGSSADSKNADGQNNELEKDSNQVRGEKLVMHTAGGESVFVGDNVNEDTHESEGCRDEKETELEQGVHKAGGESVFVGDNVNEDTHESEGCRDEKETELEQGVLVTHDEPAEQNRTQKRNRKQKNVNKEKRKSKQPVLPRAPRKFNYKCMPNLRGRFTPQQIKKNKELAARNRLLLESLKAKRMNVGKGKETEQVRKQLSHDTDGDLKGSLLQAVEESNKVRGEKLVTDETGGQSVFVRDNVNEESHESEQFNKEAEQFNKQPSNDGDGDGKGSLSQEVKECKERNSSDGDLKGSLPEHSKPVVVTGGLEANLISQIVKSREQVSQNEIELGAIYSLPRQEEGRLDMLADLAIKGEDTRMETAVRKRATSSGSSCSEDSPYLKSGQKRKRSRSRSKSSQDGSTHSRSRSRSKSSRDGEWSSSGCSKQSESSNKRQRRKKKRSPDKHEDTDTDDVDSSKSKSPQNRRKKKRSPDKHEDTDTDDVDSSKSKSPQNRFKRRRRIEESSKEESVGHEETDGETSDSYMFHKIPIKQLPGKEVDNPEVGDFCLTSEVSRTNKIMYYVVKIIDIKEEKAICEWYSFKDSNKLFVKLDAKWEVAKESLLSKVQEPIEVGRRHRVLFKDVFKFLVGSEFEL